MISVSQKVLSPVVSDCHPIGLGQSKETQSAPGIVHTLVHRGFEIENVKGNIPTPKSRI